MQETKCLLSIRFRLHLQQKGSTRNNTQRTCQDPQSESKTDLSVESKTPLGYTSPKAFQQHGVWVVCWTPLTMHVPSNNCLFRWYSGGAGIAVFMDLPLVQLAGNRQQPNPWRSRSCLSPRPWATSSNILLDPLTASCRLQVFTKTAPQTKYSYILLYLCPSLHKTIKHIVDLVTCWSWCSARIHLQTMALWWRPLLNSCSNPRVMSLCKKMALWILWFQTCYKNSYLNRCEQNPRAM